MFQPIHHKTTTTLPLPNSISRSPLRRGFLLIPLALALAGFALSPTARAQLPSPTPDGGYPNANTAEGTGALQSLTTGGGNTAIGFQALLSNTAGGANTAIGAFALQANTTGGGNTATGDSALNFNSTGSSNTANGEGALGGNRTGFQNTATGAGALNANFAGSNNTAVGFQALVASDADNNTATGFFALRLNRTGTFNTANGYQALDNNRSGNFNTANGVNALQNNNASNNTANGANALQNNNASNNTANGANALDSNTTGNSNIALGFNAGANLTTGSNNIDIGNAGVAGEANTIRIGVAGKQTTTFIAGISGATVASGVGVIVNSNGHLGTVVSSARFKEAIKPMDKASEVILALKPVAFRYKHELDPDGIPQFGLVAEQVEKVNPDLVVRGEDGKVMTVRYDAVNAMLLNEFLKEHRNVAEQQSTIAELKTTVAQQQKQIEALTATVQKVSDQVALSRPAPQLVANP